MGSWEEMFIFRSLMGVLNHAPIACPHAPKDGGEAAIREEREAVCKRVLQMLKHGMQTVAANVNWGGIMSRVSLVPTVSIMNV